MAMYLWGRKQHLSEYFKGPYRLPMIIKPAEGYYGSSEETTLEKDQVIAVCKVFQQERVIGFNSVCVLTAPYESDCQFTISKGRPNQLETLASALLKYSLPFTVNLQSELPTSSHHDLFRYTREVTITQKRSLTFLLCYDMIDDVPAREFILPIELNIDVERAHDVRYSSKYAWLPYYARLKSNLSSLPTYNARNFTDICIYQKNRNFLQILPEFLFKPCEWKSKNIPQHQGSVMYENPSILRRPPMPLPRRKSEPPELENPPSEHAPSPPSSSTLPPPPPLPLRSKRVLNKRLSTPTQLPSFRHDSETHC
ncbi:uncharacterized protein LOC106874805 isoform X2 [Octopus bimaculoides]|uniref:Uncharacterized protein n=2 Tax=Octopus bimaculoides TaxID=37653 RepID=A0A0L8GUJ8_OCTBM|nr:uncharacterized protein LOC106874805 isoform X2 [Octopus bimaculoides]XP_014778147.1 uncharacterized protein LOC106874805 isoform X2 [Octopus bimaculoides]XP_052829938.1 uncharacterized protein LOC106874805 isoform X2 [Octopus bimaculoides]XP_052829939.1 uncharacterized protein LOC106874805 isoform X2 [Octopus bimaculoides]|eukprot:XP_014778146.1 PREDICTED: uncharacterized protein LOC106874805 [Octopus bimaculoides]